MSDEDTTDPPPLTDLEPEPEGVIDIQGQKMVPVSALIAERERVRTTTDAKVRAEHEPLKARAAEADRLASVLEANRQRLEYLDRHPELLQQREDPGPQVSDDEAEKEARELELYTPTGLDLPRAKRIIAKRRDEGMAMARAAAQEAVQPMLQTTAEAAARQNFLWAASQQAADGTPLVDPRALAHKWAQFPAELAANPDVARVILDAAVGESFRSGTRPQRSGSEPTYSEASGGARPGSYRISDVERKLARSAGLSEKQWTESAKHYRSDAVNVLGD